MVVLRKDLEYTLPPELIASEPLKDRPSARLLAVDRFSGKTQHRIFSDLTDFLKAGDLLVLNDSRVIPARLFAKRASGGSVELFLLKETFSDIWKVLVRPNRKVKRGDLLLIEGSEKKLEARVLDDAIPESGERHIQLIGEDIRAGLQEAGHMPLPPYIDRPDSPEDRELYQTVYAEKEGSVAAPTAGLHFDQGLLDRLRERGVEIVTVTLHVNYATFRLIECEDVSQHPMHDEDYEISETAAAKLNQARSEKRRVIACGTTSVRVLESAVQPDGNFRAGIGSTRLFIFRPYSFKVVQGLITNFHLPCSTLLCLVDAFLEGRKLLDVYAEAIQKKYRFFSYGDAMIIH